MKLRPATETLINDAMTSERPMEPAWRWMLPADARPGDRITYGEQSYDRGTWDVVAVRAAGNNVDLDIDHHAFSTGKLIGQLTLSMHRREPLCVYVRETGRGSRYRHEVQGAW